MDAGLAKVLNSTVGTEHFRSLDKVLCSNKALVPSDNLYFNIGAFKNKTVSHSGNATAETEADVLSLKMWTDGGLRIHVSGRIQDNSVVENRCARGGFRLYKNGVLLSYVEGESATNTSSTSERSFEGKFSDVYFEIGDILEIKLYCKLSHTTTSYKGTTSIGDSDVISIYADAVDKMFDLTYIE